MKNLKLIFDLLLFPFLFLIRFVLSQGLVKHSHRGRWERGKIILTLLLLFFSINLYADNEPNNSCSSLSPGELISELNNKSASISHDEGGRLYKNSDKYDFYYFDINTDGVINVDYTSNKKTDLSIGTGGCEDNKILNNGKSVTDSIEVSSGDRIYIRVKREENKDFSYTIGLSFDIIDTGCDNSLDTSANDSFPGVTISDMHNITTDTTDCISGSSASNDNDYYNFTVAAAGTLNIITSSPNLNNNHFEVISNIQGTLYSYDTGQNRSLSYTLVANEQVIVRTKETGGNTDWWEIDLEFIATVVAQTPPTFTSAPVTTATVNSPYSYTVTTYDANGDTVTVTGTTIPSWLSFNGTTLSGTPSAADVGDHSVTLTADDGNGGTATQSFTITVSAAGANTPPTFTSTPTTTATVDTAYSYEVTTNDADGDTVTITATTIPSWLSFNGTSLSGTPAPADVGDHVVTLMADDGTDTTSQTFTITVAAAANEGYRPFTLRYQINIVGDMCTIGNTILVAPQNNGSADCDTYTDGAYIDDATSSNNNYNLCAYYADSSVNFPTTKAQLPLPNDPDLKVEWAGLYWQALVDDSYDVTQMQIKIKHENDSSYNTIGFDQLDWGDGVGHSGQISYSAFKDVTSLFVDNGWKDGEITVGDIPVIEGKISSLGTYGAWSLVVVYEQMSEELRNVTVYDGWQQVDKTNAEIDISISDFIAPKSTPISAEISVFAAEGDKHINGDYLKAKPSKKTTWTDLSHVSNQTFNSSIEVVTPFTRTPDPTNNQGIDIQAFDIGTSGVNIMEPEETKIDLKFGSDQDKYWPSMIAFSADLYKPDFCYDYSYKQNEQYFTEENDGSLDPRIVGHGLSSDPITVELYIQNRENSDILAKNMTLDIFDINTTQAIYKSNSTYLIPPGQVFQVLQNDTNSAYSYNKDIDIGTVDGKQYFYLDYDLSPKKSDIDMRLNIRLQYDLVLPYVGGEITIPRTTYLNKGIPLCSGDNFKYIPKYGTFNVENSILSQSQRYNLPTQTANRAGDFVVTAYEDNAVHTRKGLSTVVAVELIDAGKYHGIDASCREPDSALTPRIWTTFGNVADGNVSVTDFDAATLNYAIANNMVSDGISGVTTSLSSAEEFYGQARANTAFRISYQRAGTGDEVVQLEPNSCKGNQVGPCYKVLNFPDLSKVDMGAGAGVCVQDIDGNPTNTDKIPQNCGNAGNAGLDSPGLAKCMECIYGYNISYVCSRDNFATRPESFRMNLKDQDQSDATQQNLITLNDDTTKVHDTTKESLNAIQVAAGYNYALEINATNHQNDNATPGYHAELDGNSSNRVFGLTWQASNDDSKCNDTEDYNLTASFGNGAADLNLSSPQIGKYNLSIIDKLWTSVDHDPTLMTHHTIGAGAGYFQLGSDSDCVENSSIVPVQNTSTTAYADDMSGCDITTAYNDPTNDSFAYHFNTNTNSAYTDIALRIHPYKFVTSGLTIGSRPTYDDSNDTFIYINTLDETLYPDDIDENMSYNIKDTFFAAGYTDTIVSNFVDQCYAEAINMTLKHTYLSDVPTITDNLTYDLIDFNTTNPSITYPSDDDDADRNQVTFTETLVKNVNTDLTIKQATNVFNKDMKGAITMDLGFNFVRANNQVLNPRKINFSDFNITYVTNPSGIRADLKTGDDFEIFGNEDLDDNVSFFYGRAKPSKVLYDDVTENNIDTPVSIVIYCDLGYTECQDRGIQAALGAQTNEDNWWKSWDHNNQTSQDGNITLVSTPASALNRTSASITSEGEDKTINVSRGTTLPPLTIPVNLVVNDPSTPAPLNYTDRWLIYNPESATLIPSPFYRVKFIGGSGWAGHGETGHVVGGQSNSKKNNRLEW